MNNLRALRDAAGLSLQELGDLCGRSKSHMHELEKPEANPTINTAYAIAKVLNKSVYEVWPDNTQIIEETIIVKRLVVRNDKDKP